MPINVAIVGAGLSGLACARTLHDSGATVTVFERSGDVGGRLSTRRTEVGGFDHGAQYFTARTPSFQQTVEDWVAQGQAGVWPARVVKLAGDGQPNGASDTVVRYVGIPAMGALAHALMQDLDIRFEQMITRLEPVGVGKAARWTLQRPADPEELHGIEVTEGLYDAVVVAIPPLHGAQLLAGSAELTVAVRQLVFEPCFSLALGFSEALPVAYDAAFVASPKLAWVARDSSKPDRRSGERWIAHATGAWSLEHLEDDPEDVRMKMVKAFLELTKAHAQPVYTDVKRWRNAKPVEPLAQSYLYDARARLGACGDWCGGPRVEGAWASGKALAARLIAAL